jgi:hypothetical protein
MTLIAMIIMTIMMMMMRAIMTSAMERTRKKMRVLLVPARRIWRLLRVY